MKKSIAKTASSFRESSTGRCRQTESWFSPQPFGDNSSWSRSRWKPFSPSWNSRRRSAFWCRSGRCAGCAESSSLSSSSGLLSPNGGFVGKWPRCSPGTFPERKICHRWRRSRRSRKCRRTRLQLLAPKLFWWKRFPAKPTPAFSCCGFSWRWIWWRTSRYPIRH